MFYSLYNIEVAAYLQSEWEKWLKETRLTDYMFIQWHVNTKRSFVSCVMEIIIYSNKYVCDEFHAAEGKNN